MSDCFSWVFGYRFPAPSRRLGPAWLSGVAGVTPMISGAITPLSSTSSGTCGRSVLPASIHDTTETKTILNL